jgi:hypothetical protein
LLLLLLLLLCLQFDATKITRKSFAAATNKLLTKPNFVAAAAAAGRELRSRSGPNETAQLLLQFANGEPTAAVTQDSVKPAAAAAAGEVVQNDAVRADSAALAVSELQVVGSASWAAAAPDSDVAAVQDRAPTATTAAAASGKRLPNQPQQIDVAATCSARTVAV